MKIIFYPAGRSCSRTEWLLRIKKPDKNHDHDDYMSHTITIIHISFGLGRVGTLHKRFLITCEGGKS